MVLTLRLKYSIRFFKDHFVILSLLLSTFVLFFSFSAEYVWHVKPCKICKLERLSYIIIFVFSSIAFIPSCKRIGIILLKVAFLFSAVMSLYHLLVVGGVLSDPCAVPTNIVSINDFSRLLEASLPCSVAGLKIFTVPISAYSFITTLLILGVSQWENNI